MNKSRSPTSVASRVRELVILLVSKTAKRASLSEERQRFKVVVTNAKHCAIYGRMSDR